MRIKSQFLMVRVGGDELLTWQKTAKRAGLTLSEWVRQALNAKCEPVKKEVDSEAVA